ALAQPLSLQSGMDPPHRIGAGRSLPQPSLPKARAARKFQGVQTAQSSPKQHHGRLDQQSRGDAGLGTMIPEGSNKSAGEIKNLFRVGDQATENLPFPFPQTLPLQLGNFFYELLHLVIAIHGLANPWLPSLGNTDLAQFSLVPLYQIQGWMEAALSTAAGGFTAGAQAWMQGTAQEPFSRGQLGEARTQSTFCSRQLQTGDHG